MGGQACVFYGPAQFSKDVDLALPASEENFSRLLAALGELSAKRIAVPRFDPALLARGHAVHFRCQGGEADGRRGPLAVVPVASGPGVQTERRERLLGVGNERLDESGVHVRPTALAGKGPDLIREHAIDPAVLLLEHQGGGPGTPLLGAQQIIVGGREQKDRPRTPDPAAACRGFGREEEILHDVRQTGLAGGAEDVLLVNDGDNRARDDVSIFR